MNTGTGAKPTANAEYVRASERFELEIKVDLESEHNFYTGLTQNISAGGLMFDSEAQTFLGERVHIRIEFDGENFQVEAVVKHTGRLLASDLPYASGVEFLQQNKDLNRLLDTMDKWADQFD